MTNQIKLENVNHPGHVTPVDANMYRAMRRACLTALPRKSPGRTATEIGERVIAHLLEERDPETGGLVSREKTRPLRWCKA
jgi:hypothetical protein